MEQKNQNRHWTKLLPNPQKFGVVIEVELSVKVFEIDANPRICFISSVLIKQEALREQYPKEYVGELNCGSKSKGYGRIYSTASEIVMYIIYITVHYLLNGTILRW